MLYVDAITHTVLTLYNYVIMICVTATTMLKTLTCLFTTYVYVHICPSNFNFAYLRIYVDSL